MFGTIRKHQSWLWVIIISLTIISFVIFFSPYTQVSDALHRPAGGYGSIGGKAVTEEEYRDTAREVFLRYRLMHGDWPDKDPAAKQMGFDEQREAYYRLLLIRKQQELNIHISTARVAEVAAQILQDSGLKSLAAFEKAVLWPRGMRAADFERFLRHELGMQQLVAVAGLSGALVTPKQAETLYRFDHEQIETEAVFFPATNHLASVQVTTEAVAQFYTNQMARYRLPERLQVSYVKWDITNHLAEAEQEINSITNLNERLDWVYRNNTNLFRDMTPEQAKARIREEETRRLALEKARKVANEFAAALFELEPVKAENLDKFAAEKKLVVQVTDPFDRATGPQDLDVPATFTRLAFGLTDEEPLAGPVAGEDAVYVIALKRRLPSEIPPLDSIQAQVTEDYRFAQAVAQAHAQGTNFFAVLTNGLAQGKTFAAVCREAQLKSYLFPAIARSTRERPEIEAHVPLGLFQEVAFRVPPGQTSHFVPTTQGGFIVQVRSQLPLDEAQMKAELPRFMAFLRQMRQSDAFQDWFRRQAEQGLRNTPIARPPQAAAAGQ